ncbi:MAG: endopeptidase La [Chloroflexi bacterium]|nr:endopeptidase La [Chloroflexota bacterium]
MERETPPQDTTSLDTTDLETTDREAAQQGTDSDEQVSGPATEPSIPAALPVLPLRGGTVVFPLAVVPLLVGQERSIRLIDDVMRGDRMLALVAQRPDSPEQAGPDHLYSVGTAGVIHQLLRSPDGTLRLVLQGLERIRLTEFIQTEPYLKARVEMAPDQATSDDVETQALRRAVVDLFRRLVPLIEELPNELIPAAEALDDPRQLAYLVASAIPLLGTVRQELLEEDQVGAKLQRLVELLQHELAVRELGQKITSETRERMTKAQREYFLREQLRAIRKELGEEDETSPIGELRRRIEEAGLPDEARREADRELERLANVPPSSPEHGIILTYLDWMAVLPWNRCTGGEIDVPKARRILDEDHYDLEKIKDRILEHLAVKKLRQERQAVVAEVHEDGSAEMPAPTAHSETPTDRVAREPILCFVGPPGVGKTSLGQSIARALGRKFVRISLGGVHDEAEIRGHRRTYIGAMPGRIVQGIKRADARDPVFMLDEIDKVGADWRGDPSSALLEVLDPAQNYNFVDNYLGVGFDLSQVLFVTTANALDTIPAPLRDRMEVLQLSGYTDEEKVQIARTYLIPKQLAAHGLREGELTIEPSAIREVVRGYTREAGVRNLDREVAALCRKVAREIAEGSATSVTIAQGDVQRYLGRPRFFDEAAERTARPGVATGLAWTPVGGDVLFVEATCMPGQERLILTGMLGDVMRESAQAALSYIRAYGSHLAVLNHDRPRTPDSSAASTPANGCAGLDGKFFENTTVHIHVPAGAIPKDGPSAGVTILTALASLASGRPVRSDLAMTGELTLRGKVLPIGGVKEKVLAAHRAGIKTVLLPRRNERDLEDVPEELRRDLEVIFVDTAEDVLTHALEPLPEGAAQAEAEPRGGHATSKRARANGATRGSTLRTSTTRPKGERTDGADSKAPTSQRSGTPAGVPTGRKRAATSLGGESTGTGDSSVQHPGRASQ